MNELYVYWTVIPFLSAVLSRSQQFYLNVFCFPVEVLPYAGHGLLILEVSRSQTTTLHCLDEWSAPRRDIYMTTHNTYNKHTYMSQRDSNPQSQQASGRSFTPYTARPLQSADLNVMCHLLSLIISCVLIFIKRLDNRYLFYAMNMSHWTNIYMS